MSVSKLNYHPTKKMRPKPQQPKTPKKVNWLLMGFGLSAIASVSTVLGALMALSLTQTPFSQVRLSAKEEAVFNQEDAVTFSSLNIPNLSRPVNILVLGVKVLTSDIADHPKDNLGYHALVNSFDGLSDSILLLRFDPQKNDVVVLSIPRDTKTFVPDVGITKINEANAHGGPALAAESVSNMLDGVEIDRYIRINVQGVEKLIDALGGVDFYVPKDMKYSDDSQRLYINLKEGQQHLDGDKALQLLRFRYDALGDVGRVQRQQAVLRALVEQALNPRTILRMPEILGVIRSHLDTNLSTNEIIALSAFAGQKSRSNFKMVMLPGEFNQPEEGELSYWLPHPRSINKIAVEHFNATPDYYEVTEQEFNPSQVRIAIQTNPDDTEKAQSLTTALAEAGYRRVFVSSIPQNQPLAKTRIIAQNGDASTAARIRADLGIGEVLVEGTGVISTDVTIQVGADWQYSPE
ncbi:MAG: LCP family protein [Cyanobacterium sp. T60_A2020_053]|nr:LCP family protein [Cyanobacterium sp. T60_A2020_053]